PLRAALLLWRRRSPAGPRTRRAGPDAGAHPPGARSPPAVRRPPRSRPWCAGRTPGPRRGGPGRSAQRTTGSREQGRRGPRRGAPALPRAPPPSPRRSCSALVHRHQVAHEDQRLVRRDHRRGALGAVAERGGDVETAAAADLHALPALVPAGDDLAQAELEAQRLAADPGGGELLAGGVGDAHVVHVDDVAAAGLLAVADDLVDADQLGGGVALGVVDLGLGAIGHEVLLGRSWVRGQSAGRAASRTSTTKIRVSPASSPWSP